MTEDIVLEAAKEIKVGTRYNICHDANKTRSLIDAFRVSMNWPLDAQTLPFFGRQVCPAI